MMLFSKKDDGLYPPKQTDRLRKITIHCPESVTKSLEAAFVKQRSCGDKVFGYKEGSSDCTYIGCQTLKDIAFEAVDPHAGNPWEVEVELFEDELCQKCRGLKNEP
jgi:hypothetical protein